VPAARPRKGAKKIKPNNISPRKLHPELISPPPVLIVAFLIFIAPFG